VANLEADIDTLLAEVDDTVAATCDAYLAEALASVADLIDKSVTIGLDSVWYFAAGIPANWGEERDDEDDDSPYWITGEGLEVCIDTGTVWVDGRSLRNVHQASACAGRHCTVHRPSRHHMIFWPIIWRDDRTLFERCCPHGVGHPDPDQLDYWQMMGREWMAVHGCDGCCVSD
jgi:hypothetical protein